MNADAARGRHRKTSGRRPLEDSETGGQDDERDLRWSTKAECLAVQRELDGNPIDWETIECLLRGAADDVAATT